MRNKLKINLIFSIISMGVQFIQSMWITSYVQRCMGVDAYGYISVVVGIVNMAGVVSVALTSVCSRYIVIEMQGGNADKISHVFSTLYYSLLMIACVSVLLFLAVISRITWFINVTPEYVEQVSWLMFIVAIDFSLQLIQVPFLAVFYYEEKLYYSYMTVIFCNVMKMAVAIIVFNIWKPVIWAAYAGAVFVNLYAILFYSAYVRHHYPFISRKMKNFSFAKLKEILRTGIWVSISKLAATLLSSCSTYMVNILLGAYLSGIYGSLAQLQSVLSLITVTIANVFLPEMYEKYAKKQIPQLVLYTQSRIKIISIVLGFFSGGLIVYGKEFMSIWLSEEYNNWGALIVVSVIYLPATYSAEMINQLLITINKTKEIAFISIIAGVINVLLAITMVKYTPLGIYGVAGAQMIVLLVRSWVVMPIYSAIELNEKWFVFCKEQAFGMISMLVTTLCGIICHCLISISSWGELIVSCVITGISSFLILICIDKEFRLFVKNILFKSKER